MANLVEVKEEKKTTRKKKSIDLSKIKDIIDDNPEAVRKIKEGVADIITSNVLGNKTSKKSTTRKTRTTRTTASKSKKTSNSDGLSKMIDLAGTFLKK